ncbi:MAG: hypothetical protein ACT4PL_07685 [Phycisphaerales bacterium]
MNRGILWTLWAAVPIAALALHMGPGQRLLAHDRAASNLAAARELIARAAEAASGEEWHKAAEAYAAARNMLPEIERLERAKLELAEAKARLEGGEIVEAVKQLEALFEKQQQDGIVDESLTKDIRATIAEGSYYTAWVMRLEGAAEDEWKPETEKARQQYRFLAESTSGDEARGFKENLEAVIRLEQMDLSELQALPLPKKCSCCSNCSQKKREQRKSQCQGQQTGDARKTISNSAGKDAQNGKGS